MNRESYCKSFLDGTLNIDLDNFQIIFHKQPIANGHGNLRLDESGPLLTADVSQVQGTRWLPQFAPFTIIPVEHDLSFIATSPDGHQVTGQLSSIAERYSSRLSISEKPYEVTITMPLNYATKGTSFFGILPFLEKDVYDSGSMITDNNPFFGSKQGRIDWFQFGSVNSSFVVRADSDDRAKVLITTKLARQDWIDQLPSNFLAALSLRVGRKLSFVCLNRRSNGRDELTLFRGPAKTRSQIVQPMILKPATNTLFVADAVQFLFDFPDSPIGPLLYAIFDADNQPSFSLRELAIAVAIEGLAEYVVDDYSVSLATAVSQEVGKDKAVLKRTRKKFKKRMEKQNDLRVEPYYSYLISAINGAKPFTATDKIRKAIQILTPSPAIDKTHIESWKRTRNSAAHAKTTSAIDQNRLDDLLDCEYMWHWLLCELILSNPKTLSQVMKIVHHPLKAETDEAAYYQWQNTGNTDEQRNWFKAEEYIVRQKLFAAKQELENTYKVI